MAEEEQSYRWHCVSKALIAVLLQGQGAYQIMGSREVAGSGG